MECIKNEDKSYYMDFYYRKMPEHPAGIIKRIKDDILLYEPYRSFAHYELMKDLELGKECECSSADGKKMFIISRVGYEELKIKAN